jgi:DNA polymerase I
MTSTTAPYLLIDGNSLTYRAFFALPTDMTTASGQVTNAVFGFTSMLINLLKDHEPAGIVVAFDRPEPTFRHVANPAYKAQRAETPDILRQQMGLVRQVIDTLGITWVECAGWEADDLLGTMATTLRDQGHDVIVVTGDRDAYQLVEDPHVRVLYNRRGVSDYVLYDEAGIVARTGVTAAQYSQYAALRGDTSDNLPGVPGVGEKTAAKLITTYGGLDGIYAHLDELTPKIRESLASHSDHVRSNAELMIVRRDAPVTLDAAQLGWGPSDEAELKRLFEFLEFRSLWDRLAEVRGTPTSGSDGGEVLEPELTVVRDAADAEALLASLRTLDVAPGWRSDKDRAELAGLAVVTDSTTGDVAWLAEALLHDRAVADALSSSSVRGHQTKPVLRALLSLGVDVRHMALDTAIAAYLIDPAEARYDLAELLSAYTGLRMPSGSVPDGQLDLSGDGVDVPTIAAREALAVSRLAPALEAALTAQGRWCACWHAWRTSVSGSTSTSCVR